MDSAQVSLLLALFSIFQTKNSDQSVKNVSKNDNFFSEYIITFSLLSFPSWTGSGMPDFWREAATFSDKLKSCLVIIMATAYYTICFLFYGLDGTVYNCLLFHFHLHCSWYWDTLSSEHYIDKNFFMYSYVRLKSHIVMYFRLCIHDALAQKIFRIFIMKTR